MARRQRATVGRDQLLDYLESGDDLTVVLRGHLSLEALLNELLDAAVPAQLDELHRLRFLQRVDLAIALGVLDASYREGWRGVNELRNRFAHDVNASLSAGDAGALFDRLPGHHKPGLAPMVLAPFTSRYTPRHAVAVCMVDLWENAKRRP